METRRKARQADVDPVDRRELLGLRDNIDEALQRLVQDYQHMESLNQELEIRAKFAETELELANSKLKSVHENLGAYHTHQANMLNALFRGLKRPLSVIEEHIDQLSQNNPNGEGKFPLDQVRAEVHKLWKIIDDLATVEAVQLGMVELKLEKVNLEEVVNRGGCQRPPLRCRRLEAVESSLESSGGQRHLLHACRGGGDHSGEWEPARRLCEAKRRGYAKGCPEQDGDAHASRRVLW